MQQDENSPTDRACSNMRYAEIPYLTRTQVEDGLQSKDNHRRVNALLSASWYDELEWTQNKCIEFLAGSDTAMRHAALLALLHLARIHGRLDLERVYPLIRDAKATPELAGVAENLEDDIEVFIHRKRT